ncbi:family 20 glycosylhydrolase [Paraglaciecola sp.]|uniref:family 20 glycosylhydrolase n=1 Tax=Paraglaciecola sp. TaxID=1920173 RepID=UPI0030F433DA
MSKKLLTLNRRFLLLACTLFCFNQQGYANGETLPEITQSQLNQLANTLIVKYKLISNMPSFCPKDVGDFCYQAELSLTSPIEVPYSNWHIIYGQVYPPFRIESEQFNIEHINGDLNKITPKESFTGFKANQSILIKLWVKSSLINEGELLPNYILSADNLKSVVIASTKTVIDPETQLELKPYAIVSNNKEVMRSHIEDSNELASSTWLYNHYPANTKSVDYSKYAIIPTPKKLVANTLATDLDISAGIRVKLNGFSDKKMSAALEHLSSLGIAQNKKGTLVEVSLVQNENALSGSYSLVVSDKKIAITAGDDAGAFYGLQSLASLISVDAKSVPIVNVEDEPRYEYRGLHIDVARNFRSKSFILRLLAQMSAYKLNKLHLHLADDEAWRIEIPGLEELTSLAANRCIDFEDQHCLQPQLGSAINVDRDGYYSVEDYLEILAEAARHHIEVIPSMDMPGHSRAAVKAMESRYQRLMKADDAMVAKRYMLSDLEDKTQYHSMQHYRDNTLNVCMPSTYDFVEKVVGEVALLHKKAGTPLTTYHIGADETAGAWLESPLCKAFIANKANGIDDVKELTAYFIEKVSTNLANKGITVGGWNDGLSETNNNNMPKSVISYIWTTLPAGAHQVASQHAHRGWEVVLSTPDITYFDFPYEMDPKEGGYKWGSRRTNSQTVFQFMPDNLPAHAEFRTDVIGRKFSSDDRVQKDDKGNIIHRPLPEGYKIKGIQAHLWSEVIRKDHLAEYMLFPRLMALAEKAWHQASWEVPYDYNGKNYDENSGTLTLAKQQAQEEQWQLFTHTIGYKELEKLDRLGVFYRIPTVGTKIINSQMHAHSVFPGLPIEYRRNNGKWQSYITPVDIEPADNIEVRALSRNGKRPGRILKVATDQG